MNSFITNLQKAAGRVPDSRGQNLVSKQRVDGRRLSIACSPEKSDLRNNYVSSELCLKIQTQYFGVV